jgi:hypothetical protein
MSRHSHEVAGSHGLRTRSEGPGAESSREQVVGRVSPLSLSCSRRNVFLARTRISLQSKPKSLRQAERNPFHVGPNELANYNVDKGAEYYEQRNRQQQIEFLRKKAAQLGLQVTAAHP